ncbi:hypothetical protein DET59_10221 [Rossellomorea aquimaris]|uniref:Uncharacterized protein n=1 Tax=Rossellomorea aquimaris TaxID=189382 RepID=A0A366EY29_9BACI|nr:hypothetical protein DET59_10221 [Rossellomorea aquimaris]
MNVVRKGTILGIAASIQGLAMAFFYFHILSLQVGLQV